MKDNLIDLMHDLRLTRLQVDLIHHGGGDAVYGEVTYFFEDNPDDPKSILEFERDSPTYNSLKKIENLMFSERTL